MRYTLALKLVLAFGTTMAPTCFGHEHEPRKSEANAPAVATEFGSPGNAQDVRRVIEVNLLDTMRITPNEVSVRQGETLRFRIRNTGSVAHEFVLGTPKEIIEHKEMMNTMPTMKNDEANAVSIAPRRTTDLIWRFSKPGMFLFACLIPGHWEAGMQGTVTVTALAKTK